ncbi:MAG: trypsin-like peptidase domain-containing protein [Reyranella sp.]|nr:serine protease [Reyranella sp.]MBN9091259.1 trypsin-like peptidase domain-containing protein [Reyranella sp.]
MNRASWGVLVAGLAVAGCSVTVDVVGLVGSETFRGKSTGYGDGTGYMEMQSDAGTKCVGDFAFHGSRNGTAILSCNDGRQAALQFRSLRAGVGYGFGTLNTGGTVRFYYGMSDEQGAAYIAAGPGQAGPAAGGPKSGSGTGFYVTRQGHVLTNAHVVDSCGSLTVHRAGGVSAPAIIVSTDKQNDLALLQTASAPAAIATLRGNRPVRPGEAVVAFGFPIPNMVTTTGVLTTGTVSALAGLRDDTRFLQISVPIQPGNSGGPLMDMTGAVVGVTSSSLDERAAIRRSGALPQNVNFAIKTEVVRTFLATTGVSAETGGGHELGAADVGERARGFTVRIECKG